MTKHSLLQKEEERKKREQRIREKMDKEGEDVFESTGDDDGNRDETDQDEAVLTAEYQAALRCDAAALRFAAGGRHGVRPEDVHGREAPHH